jgi:hypothetical protein
MPSQSPFRIEPTKDERAILRKRAGAHTAPHWEVVRTTSDRAFGRRRDRGLRGAYQRAQGSAFGLELEGHYPEKPEQNIERLEAAARGWNRDPTPFE